MGVLSTHCEILLETQTYTRLTALEYKFLSPGEFLGKWVNWNLHTLKKTSKRCKINAMKKPLKFKKKKKIGQIKNHHLS